MADLVSDYGNIRDSIRRVSGIRDFNARIRAGGFRLYVAASERDG